MSIDLANARILISNDDGVEAPGIRVLERVARSLCDDVWVVAPERERSGAGHSLSLHEPLRYRQLEERRFWVGGTPTDAVLLGVMELVKGKKPTLMLSGINRGSNLAEDVTYSGTVSAAMEATLLEIPAIAFSNAMKGEEIHWDTAEHFAPDIIRALCGFDWPADTMMNVNFPCLPIAQVKGVRACPQGRRKLDDNLHRRVDPAGRPYIWIGGQRTVPFTEHPEADYRQLLDGYVTVTPLNLDLTNHALMDTVKHAVEEGAATRRKGHA